MPEKWKTDLSRITPEARAIVDEMEQVYVGPDGDRKTIREVGDWRTILDMAGERIAALEAEKLEMLWALRLVAAAPPHELDDVLPAAWRMVEKYGGEDA